MLVLVITCISLMFARIRPFVSKPVAQIRKSHTNNGLFESNPCIRGGIVAVGAVAGGVTGATIVVKEAVPSKSFTYNATRAVGAIFMGSAIGTVSGVLLSFYEVSVPIIVTACAISAYQTNQSKK